MSACQSCGAPIWWGVHHRTGSRIPVDPAQTGAGNIVVIGQARHQPTVAVLAETSQRRLPGLDELAQLGVDPDSCARYTPHHATCPHASTWRRPR